MPAKIAIVGVGWVGKSMYRIFPDAVLYDEPQGIGTREDVNECDIALVCVPTPSLPHGECDLSIIRDVVSWIEGPIICIKSAMVPGTVAALLAEHPAKRIVVSPEYIGEGISWTAKTQAEPWPYVICGGERTAARIVLDAFEEALGSSVEYHWEANARTVELVKYAENVYLAMQVTWANELHEIAHACGADYEAMRDLWAADPRISATHTDVTPERGFSGRCLPKDLAALISCAMAVGYNPKFLRDIQAANDRFRNG